MFFNLFGSQPRLPPGWNHIHVWIAQVLFCSILAAERDSIGMKGRTKQQLNTLRKKFRAFALLPCNQRWFPTETIREVLLCGIDFYLDYEWSGIQKALSSGVNRPMDINKSALLAAIKEDRKFARYVNSTNILKKETDPMNPQARMTDAE